MKWGIFGDSRRALLEAVAEAARCSAVAASPGLQDHRGLALF